MPRLSQLCGWCQALMLGVNEVRSPLNLAGVPQALREGSTSFFKEERGDVIIRTAARRSHSRVQALRISHCQKGDLVHDSLDF
jgi:hypothetical protein